MGGFLVVIENLLEISNLSISYTELSFKKLNPLVKKRNIEAINNLTFNVKRGETFGIKGLN